MGKKCQIWVETVIYTLIFLVLMGLVLAFAKPKLEEMSDKAIIEQTMDVMETIDDSILSIIQGGSGNIRKIDLTLKKGILKIDGINNALIFRLESRYTYTEPGKDVTVGRIVSKTEKLGKINKVILTMNYSDYNITFEGIKKIKTITAASTPYKLFIANKGGTIPLIDFKLK